MVDTVMVDLAGDCPMYMVDYFTLAVTSPFLESLREEFEIPNGVKMIVLGPNDLPSRPPPGYITLSAEFFRAELCLQFHPFLRRALQRLNVALMQLNANASNFDKLLRSLGKALCLEVVVQGLLESLLNEDSPLVGRIILLSRLPRDLRYPHGALRVPWI